jgi:ADP-ribose pyrophosphatase YjhB (NUDIX family)
MQDAQATQSFRVLVLAIIIDGGKVLIIQRAKESPEVPDLHWSLPGGKLEPGERLEEALHREVQEETGLHVVVEALVHARVIPKTTVLALYYHCKLAPNSPVMIEPNRTEVAEVNWATGQEALTRFTSDIAKPLADLLQKIA